MKRFYKYVLVAIGIDLLAIVILLHVSGNDLEGALLWLLMVGILMLIQFITGIALTFNTEKQDLGRALLASIGIILLVGLSICGIAVNT